MTSVVASPTFIKTVCSIAAILPALIPSALSAEDRVTLTTRDGKQQSSAVRTAESLAITSELGGRTEYLRKTQFDSTDGQWLGYYSSSAQQVVRWPSSGVGNLQVGKLVGSRPAYRKSLMQIAGTPTQPNPPPGRPLVDKPIVNGKPAQKTGNASVQFRYANLPEAQPERLNAISGLREYRVESEAVKLFEKRQANRDRGTTQTLRLASLDGDAQSAELLGLGTDESLRTTTGGQQAQDWTFAEVGGGLFRIQSRKGKRLHALAARSRRGVGLAVPAADARQLWRPIAHPRRGYIFAFESVYYPGYCLSHTGGGIYLNPFSYAPGQFWLPVSPLAPLAIQPLLRNFHTDIIPNPALPPVTVRLTNSQQRPIEILIGSTVAQQQPERIKIAPRAAEAVTLERDAGSTVTEYSEVLMWDGSWHTQTFTTEIPPRQLYDISVYEVRLQSIAIDRTGKSPNVIEDVNYQPRSIGRFPVPGGAAITEGQSLDVFALAKRQQNPGAVLRFSIDELENYEAPEASMDGPTWPPTRRKF